MTPHISSLSRRIRRKLDEDECLSASVHPTSIRSSFLTVLAQGFGQAWSRAASNPSPSEHECRLLTGAVATAGRLTSLVASKRALVDGDHPRTRRRSPSRHRGYAHGAEVVRWERLSLRSKRPITVSMMGGNQAVPGRATPRLRRLATSRPSPRNAAALPVSSRPSRTLWPEGRHTLVSVGRFQGFRDGRVPAQLDERARARAPCLERPTAAPLRGRLYGSSRSVVRRRLVRWGDMSNVPPAGATSK